ncbi:MAG TPA: cytochrome C oxidase subunit IV [Micrococcales bacterium]|uniref:Cytochrome c oxidase polypeptide 4 n=1 Tax=Miniimonas arenae TaxID=676201 RepID=A0A5C5BD99_9MICO|nr:MULTISPECIES: cytochrome c oxidase subunit 4 [Miniimonas]TNU73826.1 cytochrome c oxidase subunit 4 [Miniimonas arenae]HCX84937.1 cytochrome C oxidase subunit IV [Micrococcales bacterium]
MFVETVVFGALVPFFILVGVVYIVLTDFEPVGSVAILLLAGLAGLVAFFLFATGRRIDARPEDDPLGTVESAAGEYGEFSPHSWWPFVLACGAAVLFLGVAVGWWVCVIGAVVGLIGLVGLLFEHSRGQHAH